MVLGRTDDHLAKDRWSDPSTRWPDLTISIQPVVTDSHP